MVSMSTIRVANAAALTAGSPLSCRDGRPSGGGGWTCLNGCSEVPWRNRCRRSLGKCTVIFDMPVGAFRNVVGAQRPNGVAKTGMCPHPRLSTHEVCR